MSVCGRTTISVIETKPRQTDNVAMRLTSDCQEIIQHTTILLPSATQIVELGTVFTLDRLHP
jgi:hypothetical protein